MGSHSISGRLVSPVDTALATYTAWTWLGFLPLLSFVVTVSIAMPSICAEQGQMLTIAQDQLQRVRYRCTSSDLVADERFTGSSHVAERNHLQSYQYSLQDEKCHSNEMRGSHEKLASRPSLPGNNRRLLSNSLLVLHGLALARSRSIETLILFALYLAHRRLYHNLQQKGSCPSAPFWRPPPRPSALCLPLVHSHHLIAIIPSFVLQYAPVSPPHAQRPQLPLSGSGRTE
jgi:hypothetical protein